MSINNYIVNGQYCQFMAEDAPSGAVLVPPIPCLCAIWGGSSWTYAAPPPPCPIAGQPGLAELDRTNIYIANDTPLQPAEVETVINYRSAIRAFLLSPHTVAFPTTPYAATEARYLLGTGGG